MLWPMYVTGSTVTEDATPFSLDVTAGQYYYGTVLYSPSGASPITMSIRYRGSRRNMDIYQWNWC